MDALKVFKSSNVHDKLAALEASCHTALFLTSRVEVESTAREEEIRDFWMMPPRVGFAKVEGQARLIHDLANIELQATELALRTLCEFPDAPTELREELCALAIDEGRHLKLCLDGLSELGFKWGDWPIHMNLWEAVSNEDSLLDRLLIVHRYLEGAGLDSGYAVLNRLTNVDAKVATNVVGTIVRDEVGHVAFGSKWYHHLCNEQKLDITTDFYQRIERVVKRNPKKEIMAYDLRKKAGFLDVELQSLETLRLKYWNLKVRRNQVQV